LSLLVAQFFVREHLAQPFTLLVTRTEKLRLKNALLGIASLRDELLYALLLLSLA